MNTMELYVLVDQLLATSPYVEEPIRDVLIALLGKMEWCGFLNENKHDVALISIRGENFVFDIQVMVQKGSLLTYLWNKFARIDDEYSAFLQVRNQEQDSPQMMWHVAGLDYVNKRIHQCTICWPLLRGLQQQCGAMNTIGLQCFGKLLIHTLINIPAYFQYQKVMPPMPAAFMHNCMLVVESCPVAISIAPAIITADVEKLISKFRDDTYGHALWIRNLHPYWTTHNQKVLCPPQQAASSAVLMNMCSADTLHDIAIRIIEIFPTPLNDVGYGVVLEIVNRQRWVHIVRFVVTDMTTLRTILSDKYHHCSQQSRTSMGEWSDNDSTKKFSVKKSRAASTIPKTCLRLYDETEWIAACNAWDCEHSEHQGQHYYIDFRNSSKWGIESL